MSVKALVIGTKAVYRVFRVKLGKQGVRVTWRGLEGKEGEGTRLRHGINSVVRHVLVFLLAFVEVGVLLAETVTICSEGGMGF